MARNANSKSPASPSVQPEVTEQVTAALETLASDPQTVVSIKTPVSPGSSLVSKTSLMASIGTEMSKAIADKMTVIGATKQRFAEAFDAYSKGKDASKEGDDIAAKAAVPLYQARAAGIVSAAEVSEVMGNVFGFKAKADGSTGKTPDGRGEDIRKRIVRMVAAREYLDAMATEEGRAGYDGFFMVGDAPIDPALESDAVRSAGLTVQNVVTSVDAGEMTIWNAYEYLADVKKTASTAPVKPAFNPKTIAAIADALSEGGGKAAAETYRKDKALVMAYKALLDVLSVVDELAVAMNAADEEAAIAA